MFIDCPYSKWHFCHYLVRNMFGDILFHPDDFILRKLNQTELVKKFVGTQKKKKKKWSHPLFDGQHNIEYINIETYCSDPSGLTWTCSPGSHAQRRRRRSRQHVAPDVCLCFLLWIPLSRHAPSHLATKKKKTSLP